MTSTLTWQQAVAPVRRARLLTPLSPSGNAPTGRDASINCRLSNSTGRCVEFVRCGRNALQPKAVEGGGCKSIRRKPGCNRARALQQSADYDEYRQLRVVVEHRLARLEQLGIRQARYFGRVKTKFQRDCKTILPRIPLQVAWWYFARDRSRLTVSRQLLIGFAH